MKDTSMSFEILKKNLSSFTEVDSRDQHKWQRFVRDYYESLGAKYLGAGKYAVVFSMYCFGMKKEIVIKVFMKDAAYFRWLNFAVLNQHNPYVPQIYGKIVQLTDLFYYVEMEKLDPASYDEINVLYEEMEDEQNGFVQDVAAEFDKNDWLLDLHSENIMLRGTQVVVIDPYYNWFKRGQFMIDPNEVPHGLVKE